MSLDSSTYPQNLSNGTFGIAVVDRGQFTATQLALESADPGASLVGCKDARQNAVELWGEDDQDYLYPYYASLTVLESEEYASIESDIYTYVGEMTLKFITGAADPETEWDDYVATIEGMGVERIAEMKQDALERYLSH